MLTSWPTGRKEALLNLSRLAFRLLLGRRLPHTQGTLTVAGPRAPVRIHRDRRGIPLIEASDLGDAHFAVGFCHGEDRAFQLEFLLRVARGTLSEQIGPPGLSVDRLARRIGFYHAAIRQLPLLEDDVRARLELYARGASAGAALGCPRLAHEFTLLKARPTPFTPLDTLAITKPLSFTLSGNWDAELARLKILTADGPEALAALDPSYPDWHPVTSPPGRSAGPVIDLFIGQIGPDGASVRQGEGYVPCPVREEVILVKGSAPVNERVLVTPRGPVISPALPEITQAVSLRASWLDPAPIGGLLLIRPVRNFTEFRRAFADWPAASQNMVYAGAGGTIGWQLIGRAPVRRKGHGVLPQPGWDPAVGWEPTPIPAEALRSANPRLVPLVAHDRATFGGMLVANGLGLLLSTLWGFRPCSAWLWWTQLVAGVLAYAAAIAVHLAVGYIDPWHLAPAYGGLAVFLLGLGLSYPFLCRPGATPAEWRRFRHREGPAG
jgi:acyl-homoserine lactone acylase PvdQ